MYIIFLDNQKAVKRIWFYMSRVFDAYILLKLLMHIKNLHIFTIENLFIYILEHDFSSNAWLKAYWR